LKLRVVYSEFALVQGVDDLPWQGDALERVIAALGMSVCRNLTLGTWVHECDVGG
jgi:hypothetical protein